MRKRLPLITELFVTCFYIGKIPIAPGTFGTLFAMPFAWLLAQTSPNIYLIATTVLMLLSAAGAEIHERVTKLHDPGEIVIDEVVGYFIAMAWLPLTWQSLVGAFLLFRLFDIWKPWPISHIDERVEGGLGTILDDAAAGLAANFVLQIIYFQTAWLGAQALVT